ncbi:MAG: hypothetical protein JHD16_08775 [Solirubrobacteraceae bacterium]|nr:hypothetical protein [Solirubrobacteraceae bacterium]
MSLLRALRPTSAPRTRLMLLAATVAVAAAPTSAAAAVTPANDPWYQAPANIAALEPGAVIRSRGTALQVAPGLKLPFKAHQVLYRTADQQGRPVATAATIIMPLRRPATNRKLVSHQIAYDGLASKCMPSYALRTGTYAEPVAEMALIAGELAKGWTVVTSDYEGPDNLWIAGKMAGQAVLDGIRAAQAYEPAGLDGAATPVGLTGYSGGGHATAWANELAATYAPELDIKGATQGGVPANPDLLLGSLDGGPFAGVLFAAITGLMRAYPDIDFSPYLNNKGRATMRQVGKECITEFIVARPFQTLRSLSTVPDIRKIPEVQQVIAENTLGTRPPSVPTLMYHAKDDELVAYPGAAIAAAQYCEQGATLQFLSVRGGHAGPAVTQASRALSYLQQRFAGLPAPTTCPAPPREAN